MRCEVRIAPMVVPPDEANRSRGYRRVRGTIPGEPTIPTELVGMTLDYAAPFYVANLIMSNPMTAEGLFSSMSNQSRSNFVRYLVSEGRSNLDMVKILVSIKGAINDQSLSGFEPRDIDYIFNNEFALDLINKFNIELVKSYIQFLISTRPRRRQAMLYSKHKLTVVVGAMKRDLRYTIMIDTPFLDTLGRRRPLGQMAYEFEEGAFYNYNLLPPYYY